MITIDLKALNFYALHGLYAEERKTGNEFEVNLSVSYEPPEDNLKSSTPLIDYTVLFNVVQKQMKKPVDTLETLVTSIAEEVKSVYPQVKKIKVSVAKLHPPIAGFTGNVNVSLQKDY